jgi:hypothetical protein
MILRVSRPGDGVHPEPLRPQLMTPPLAWREGAPVTHASLLNDSQRRHLGITLSQLQRLLREIAILVNTPAPRDGLVTEADDVPAEFTRHAPQVIALLNARIGELTNRFDLPHREQSRLRWVRAVLGIGIDDLQDTRAVSLRSYGDVHPALAAALDPAVQELQRQLRGLLFLRESGTGRPA